MRHIDNQRRFDARIYGVLKDEPDLRVYVTDATGRVVFDSTGRDVGPDYTRSFEQVFADLTKSGVLAPLR